jgi:hypothetical protein
LQGLLTHPKTRESGFLHFYLVVLCFLFPEA